jgi:hypothetical protein
MSDALAVGLSGLQRITHGKPDGQANCDQYCNVRNRCAHPLFIAHKIEAFVFYNVTLITVGRFRTPAARGSLTAAIAVTIYNHDGSTVGCTPGVVLDWVWEESGPDFLSGAVELYFAK